jgi:Tfp pilus assembly PilM family ATPase
MLRRNSKSSFAVGLSLSDDSTQVVGLWVDGQSLTLHSIAEWRGGLQDPPASMVERLTAFMTANAVTTKAISVTVDPAALFIHILPVPRGQSAAVLQKNGQWDIAQFFPEARESDFITDVQILGDEADGHYSRALCVAIRRTFSHDLQQALEARDFELRLLDGGQFSAEHYVTHCHPEGRRGAVMLMGVKQDRLDYSILRNGSLVDYGVWDNPSMEFCAARISEHEALNGVFQRVLLFGPRASTQAVEVLRTMVPTAELLNPFAGMAIALRNPLAIHFLQAPQRFVPAVGAALRED